MIRLGKLAVSFSIVALLLVGAPARAGDENQQDVLYRLTTPVEVYFEDGSSTSASGFFFRVATPTAEKPEASSSRVSGFYLVTNKHVIEGDDAKRVSAIAFYLRHFANDPREWVRVTIPRHDLVARLRPHPNGEVDVVVIDVLDLAAAALREHSESCQVGDPPICLETWPAISREHFPDANRPQVSTGDDVIVLGYPRGLFDAYNKLPIVKRGLLITIWGIGYENLDAFLVEHRGFPGSSGSLVISKPTYLHLENGKWQYDESKQFLFLGIYSGELLGGSSTNQQMESSAMGNPRSDAGMVWYYYTVEEAIGLKPTRPQGLAARMQSP